MNFAPACLAALLLLAPATSAPDSAGSARAEVQPTLLRLPVPPPAARGIGGKIDPEAATRAYLDLLPADQRAKSNAYFEGGYWLLLVDFLWNAAIALVLLHTGFSARMRDRAERWSRRAALQTFFFWLQYLAVTTLLLSPLTVFTGYSREHAYGLSNLAFGAWLGEEAKGLLLSLVLGTLALVALYGIVRRLGRTWWIWGTGVTIVFFAVGALVAPVLIVPLFNSPHVLQDKRVVAPILSLARANGIPAGEVWEVDASKQSKRVSANVSGFLGTERITLNDNLLARCSLPEIEAVMGHEMGHYVLNHIYKFILMFSLLILIGFALLNALFERLRVRYPRWQVRGLGDTAGLPLALLLLSAWFLLLTPITNSIVRVQEYEADIFGLNASQRPDGFAQVALKLSEYRKLEPGPLEEIIFFDHPSGRTRIFSAMRWKAEHPDSWGAALTGQ
jgi:STE24 endopeptidase